MYFVFIYDLSTIQLLKKRSIVHNHLMIIIMNINVTNTKNEAPGSKLTSEKKKGHVRNP